jgi:hypothetical protein
MKKLVARVVMAISLGSPLKKLITGLVVVGVGLAIFAFMISDSKSTEGNITATGVLGSWSVSVDTCQSLYAGDVQAVRFGREGSSAMNELTVEYEYGPKQTPQRRITVEGPASGTLDDLEGLPITTFGQERCPELQANLQWGEPIGHNRRELDGSLDFTCNNGSSSVTGHIEFTGCD